MNIDKVLAALTVAKSELQNVVNAQAKVLTDPKGDVESKAAASKGLNAAGKINSALLRAEKKIEGALKRLTPRERKAKTTPAAAAPVAAGKGKNAA